MVLPIVLGIGAFVILAIMFALLGLSSRREEREDTVTQEIVVKAQTGPVHVHGPLIVQPTQEEED